MKRICFLIICLLLSACPVMAEETKQAGRNGMTITWIGHSCFKIESNGFTHDRHMFEHLTLECLQCGLSWDLMLKKREIFRLCFDNFDYDKIAEYTEADEERILNTEGMIRSPRKVQAVINNARCYQKVREEYGSFSDYIWSYSGGKTILYQGHDTGPIRVSNGLSDRISKDLKKRGFKYVGAVTIYSLLQACGIINDHDKDCPCYKRIVKDYPTVNKRRDHEVM